MPETANALSTALSTSRQREARRYDDLDRIWSLFDRNILRRVCTMRERTFGRHYGMAVTEVAQRAPEDFYAFLDRGASVLAVAHLDTVQQGPNRDCHFVDTAAGPVVFSGALDDRLGAYVILDLLPKLGIETDVLLTVGEESGKSTAAFFDAPRQYDWIIEFDRGGTDVVMYQYEDLDTAGLVRDCGAKVGTGSFSDISYLEHLGAKAFNWGVGYQDYHSARGHAFLADTFTMLAKFVEFHRVNDGVTLPHSEDIPLGPGWSEDDEEAQEYLHWWQQQTSQYKPLPFALSRYPNAHSL